MLRWPRWSFYLVFLSVIFADQLLKSWSTHELRFSGSLSLWPGFFDLTYVENTGVAFGLIAGKGLLVGILIFAVLVSYLLFYNGLNWATWETNCISGLLCGGALSNLLDRLRLGHVVDMLNVHIGTFHWPVFNLADSAICIAVGWIFAQQIFRFEAKPVTTTQLDSPN